LASNELFLDSLITKVLERTLCQLLEEGRGGGVSWDVFLRAKRFSVVREGWAGAFSACRNPVSADIHSRRVFFVSRAMHAFVMVAP
jgi:hypothetical protein